MPKKDKPVKPDKPEKPDVKPVKPDVKPVKPEKLIKYPPGKKPLKYWKPPKAEKLERFRDPDTDVIIELDRKNKHKTIIVEGLAPAPGFRVILAVPSMPFSEISKPIHEIDVKKLKKLDDK